MHFHCLAALLKLRFTAKRVRIGTPQDYCARVQLPCYIEDRQFGNCLLKTWQGLILLGLAVVNTTPSRGGGGGGGLDKEVAGLRHC